jgi:hypothetical protein
MGGNTTTFEAHVFIVQYYIKNYLDWIDNVESTYSPSGYHRTTARGPKVSTFLLEFSTLNTKFDCMYRVDFVAKPQVFFGYFLARDAIFAHLSL